MMGHNRFRILNSVCTLTTLANSAWLGLSEALRSLRASSSGNRFVS